MDQRIDRMFKDYQEAFSSLNVEKSASFYAENIISAGPQGAAATSREEVVNMANKKAKYYRSIGFQKCNIGSIEEIPMTKDYSWIRVQWIITFQMDVEITVKMTMSYIVQKNIPDPCVIVFIAHENEDEAFEKLGMQIVEITSE